LLSFLLRLVAEVMLVFRGHNGKPRRDKRGLSALLLQRQLALARYETAWMMLHKFRRAMINLKRDPLRGAVEVDDTWVGSTQAGLRGQPPT
jgi:hypothetical protein